MSANLLIEILEMNSNPFIDRLIRERCSQRGFLEQPVAIGIVKGVFSTASHAPSTGNAQHADPRCTPEGRKPALPSGACMRGLGCLRSERCQTFFSNRSHVLRAQRGAAPRR